MRKLEVKIEEVEVGFLMTQRATATGEVSKLFAFSSLEELVDKLYELHEAKEVSDGKS